LESAFKAATRERTDAMMTTPGPIFGRQSPACAGLPICQRGVRQQSERGDVAHPQTTSQYICNWATLSKGGVHRCGILTLWIASENEPTLELGELLLKGRIRGAEILIVNGHASSTLAQLW
jgi:hypothetical protein